LFWAPQNLWSTAPECPVTTISQNCFCFLKYGFSEPFEDPECRVSAYCSVVRSGQRIVPLSRQVWSQSPLVRAVGILDSFPSKKILHWANFCFSAHEIAQSCRHTTREAF